MAREKMVEDVGNELLGRRPFLCVVICCRVYGHVHVHTCECMYLVVVYAKCGCICVNVSCVRDRERGREEREEESKPYNTRILVRLHEATEIERQTAREK
jgi:hypothetical protein